MSNYLKILRFWKKSLFLPARGAMPNIGAKNLPMDETDQKRARSKFFSLDAWRVFGPPSGKKKEIWFMLKHGQNSRFNFHIIEKLSAPWWLRWKERNLFDPMGFLWDVYWPHWPSLVQIRGPPWVRHESLAPRISVKVFINMIGGI